MIPSSPMVLYILSESLSSFSSPPLTNWLFCPKAYILSQSLSSFSSPPVTTRPWQKDPNWSRGRKNRDQDPTSAALAVSPERKDVATSGKGKRERVKLSDSCMELGICPKCNLISLPTPMETIWSWKPTSQHTNN